MFLLQVAGEMPTVAYTYLSGLFLALAVFGATYFHRQIGLITLLLVGLICARNVETAEIVEQMGQEAARSFIEHWNRSSRMTFALSVILFFAAIILKRRLKRKIKFD